MPPAPVGAPPAPVELVALPVEVPVLLVVALVPAVDVDVEVDGVPVVPVVDLEPPPSSSPPQAVASDVPTKNKAGTKKRACCGCDRRRPLD